MRFNEQNEGSKMRSDSQVLIGFLNKNINVGLSYSFSEKEPKGLVTVNGKLTGIDEKFLILNNEMVYNLDYVVYVSQTE